MRYRPTLLVAATLQLIGWSLVVGAVGSSPRLAGGILLALSLASLALLVLVHRLVVQARQPAVARIDVLSAADLDFGSIDAEVDSPRVAALVG